MQPRGCAGLALAVTLGSGCGALDDFETTIVDQATIPGTFAPGSPLGLPYDGAFNNLVLSADRNFQNNGVEPGDVDAIFVKSVVIEGTEPEKDRLDVLLKSVELYIEAPGVERRLLASSTTFPMGASVNLQHDADLNLKPYAVAESMSLSATVELERQPTFQTTLRTVVTLLVDINLLGT